MHHVMRAASIVLEPAYAGHGEGFRRCELVGRETGSVHMGIGMCSLDAGGRVDGHVHSFEESFFVLEGTPTLVLDGRAYPLLPGACGVVPVGVHHAWRGAPAGASRWIDSQVPQPRGDALPADTFFVEGEPGVGSGELDIRDPRSRHLFRLTDAEMVLDNLKRGAPTDAPTVSASMATALLAYSGIAVKMLVDQRLDAQLSTMFMVEYQPGGVAQPHDHPLEESYYILEGVVDATADGAGYRLEAGDFLWTGVGCIHSFLNATDGTVRWLETQAPQPPARHSYRFDRDWAYLEDKLREDGPPTGAGTGA